MPTMATPRWDLVEKKIIVAMNSIRPKVNRVAHRFLCSPEIEIVLSYLSFCAIFTYITYMIH
jgi:hypothetical protein